MRFARRCTSLALCAIVLNGAQASESSSLRRAEAGRAVWAAFECHALANVIGDPATSKRLFLHGMAQGRQFLEDMQAGRIVSSDIHSVVPMGVLDALSGPNADFVLGRIFESAAEAALHDFKGASLDKYMDERRAFAQSRFTQSNCRLVGR
ncbi:hypothetical protein [Achromobacter insolitus]|uniref:hypothetical protein n=1 Tax=Achromobacter insolitus TaxID=217204 RepID=UPI0020A4F82C|nr:hypothetical protein [Achromobacter insolitus]MCP1404593.1 hypothetical protein [Achromobacter insolitus]